MKILIFSDSHLTGNFDEKKYNFLKKIISSSDQVIINGDFWDGAMTTFSQFVQSPWKKLFPLLKNKKTIYVFGNHDKNKYADNRTSLFSIEQVERYILKSGDHTFIVEHGHKTQPKIFSKFSFLPRNRFFQILLNTIFEKFEEFLLKVFGEKTIQRKWYGKLNQETKINIKKYIKHGEIYICGHTHSQELDLKNQYINTGIVRYGLGQYLTIDGNKIDLKEEWYA